MEIRISSNKMTGVFVIICQFRLVFQSSYAKQIITCRVCKMMPKKIVRQSVDCSKSKTPKVEQDIWFVSSQPEENTTTEQTKSYSPLRSSSENLSDEIQSPQHVGHYSEITSYSIYDDSNLHDAIETMETERAIEKQKSKTETVRTSKSQDNRGPSRMDLLLAKIGPEHEVELFKEFFEVVENDGKNITASCLGCDKKYKAMTNCYSNLTTHLKVKRHN